MKQLPCVLVVEPLLIVGIGLFYLTWPSEQHLDVNDKASLQVKNVTPRPLLLSHLDSKEGHLMQSFEQKFGAVTFFIF